MQNDILGFHIFFRKKKREGFLEDLFSSSFLRVIPNRTLSNTPKKGARISRHFGNRNTSDNLDDRERALAKLETDESNVCLERERCFSSTKRLLGGVVEVFEESGDESDADGENGGTLKCRNIFFCG